MRRKQVYSLLTLVYFCAESVRLNLMSSPGHFSFEEAYILYQVKKKNKKNKNF